MKLTHLLLILFLSIVMLFVFVSEEIITKAENTQKSDSAHSNKEEKTKLDLDQILAKYYDAIGGLEKWQNLNTIIMKGKISTQDASMPMNAYHARPNKCRIEFIVKDTMMSQIYSGMIGWQINPLSGNPL